MKNLLFIFITIIFVGCEPAYNVSIHNNSPNTLYIKTSPSIESLLYSKSGSHYDSIINRKVGQTDKYSLYSLKPFDTFRLWGNIGGWPVLYELPFDYVEIINSTDTLILDSKEKIMNQVKKGNRKRDFYIEIVPQ